jgi:hypothetical protein
MKEFFKDIIPDRIIISAFFINIFLIITTVVYILISYGKLPPFVPVFNQLPWGEQRLGPTFTNNCRNSVVFNSDKKIGSS